MRRHSLWQNGLRMARYETRVEHISGLFAAGSGGDVSGLTFIGLDATKLADDATGTQNLIIDDDNSGGGKSYAELTYDADRAQKLTYITDSSEITDEWKKTAQHVTEDEAFGIRLKTKDSTKTAYGILENENGSGDFTTYTFKSLSKADVAANIMENNANWDDPAQRTKDYQRLIDLGYKPKEAQDFMAREKKLEWMDEQLTSSKWARWGTAIKELAALGVQTVQSILAFKQMEIQGRLMTMREQGQTAAIAIQKEMITREDAYRLKVADIDLEKERLKSSTEVQKARIAADVKKSKIKSQSMESLFFQRRNYGYGSPQYA